MGRGDRYKGFWLGNLRGRDHLEDLGIYREISGIRGHGLDRTGSGKGQVAGTCECGNEASDSTKCWEFLD
jgi:hypothetical protein